MRATTGHIAMLGPSYGQWWKVTAAQKRRRVLLAVLPSVALLIWALSGLFSDDRLAKALFDAVAQGDQSQFRELLARGAPVGARNTRGATLLIWSLDNRQPELAMTAIEAGVSVSAVDQHGISALHLAADQGQLRLAKRILDEGANPDVYNARYGTPLHRAAAAGHSAVVAQLLASGAVVDPRDQQGLTPLYHAVRFGKRPTAGLLLNRGANANIADRSRRRPLHWAAQSNQRGLIEPLLSAGANLEAVDTRGNTALHLAARRGYREFASQLLAAGAAINARTPDLLVTPLHLAVQQGDLGMVQELLNAGAYTNAMSQLYGTPLHWIALSRETDPKTASDIVATLLAAGANPELTDVHGYTPAQRAQQLGHNSLAKSLAATGTDKKSYGQLPALASKDCQMPDQMHRASRVVLDNYLNGELGKAEYRRRFSLPNSDYVALAECLSTQ